MELFFKALDNAADGAYVIDADQRIVYWNAAAQKILGYGADEVLGRFCYEIVRGRDDDDRAWCRGDCVVTTSVKSGESVPSFNTLARGKSGNLHWINVSILAVPITEDNAPTLVAHIFRDVSLAKQHEAFTIQVLGAVQSLDGAKPASPEPAPVAPASTGLTNRERDVLSLLARGMDTKSIASTLSISPSTARNHIQNILQKLQVHNRAAAVAYAFEYGLVNGE